MRDVVLWYDRQRMPYQADKAIVRAYADWLRDVKWQLFCTFTFAWRVSDPQAAKAFDEFINILERHYRADVAYVRGDEKRFSGCGKPACARHYHALFASAARLDPALIECVWTEMAGKRTEGTSAKAVPYCPELDGVSYVFKLVTQPDGDWAAHKLELFLPVTGESQATTHHSRRIMQRHSKRVHSYASGSFLMQ